MSKLDELVFVRSLKAELPDTNKARPLGILDKGKGAVAFLNILDHISFLSVLELIPGTGVRGNHHHTVKHENMYVIQGKLRGLYSLPDHPKEIREIILTGGDLVTIRPGLVHGYEAIEPTIAVEFSAQVHDPSDTFKSSGG